MGGNWLKLVTNKDIDKEMTQNTDMLMRDKSENGSRFLGGVLLPLSRRLPDISTYLNIDRV